jgi:1,4-dihydroxy-6-naphthoate synthase
VFHALVHGLVEGAPPVEVTYADVDVTNTASLDGRYDLVKVSYAALPWLLDRYALLPCGGALGYGCGPLVLTRGGEAGGTVAVPGDRTTAYLLFRLWSAKTPPERVEVVPFHEIMPGVAEGRYDAGLVIHEARFTYQRYGLTAVADLGEWWQEQTAASLGSSGATSSGLPIPLGAILAKRDTVDPTLAAGWIRASVRHAWAHPAASQDYVLSHAQEMEPDVVAEHIGLYVNRFTEDLGDEGYAAVRALLRRAADEGLTPPVPSDL